MFNGSEVRTITKAEALQLLMEAPHRHDEVLLWVKEAIDGAEELQQAAWTVEELLAAKVAVNNARSMKASLEELEVLLTR